MIRASTSVFVAGALLVSTQAFAQAPATSPSSSSSPAPTAVTDAELAAFARGTLDLHGLADRTPEAMAAAIAKTGLSVERYNAISAQMRADPAFQWRANTEIQAAMLVDARKAPGSASASNTPGSASSAGSASSSATDMSAHRVPASS